MRESSKQKVSHISAVTLIFPENNPTIFFCDLKDEGYIFPWSLIMTGGNWVGDEARTDKNPNDTAVREIMEELTLTPTQQRGVDADLLFGGGSGDFTRPRPLIEPISEDLELLEKLKKAIAELRRPFMDFWQVASGDDLWRLSGVRYKQRMSKKGVTRTDDIRGICSVGLSSLSMKNWESLSYLQGKYKNISQESLSFIASLDQILGGGPRFSYGQDCMYHNILIKNGIYPPIHFHCSPEYRVVAIGKPMDSYERYLELYEIGKKPV